MTLNLDTICLVVIAVCAVILTLHFTPPRVARKSSALRDALFDAREYA